ncbi:MAG: class I SAM-dependent rRNA methyltransferase [Treponema sp.]|nr:class I SAM-dependent rRNA methyltransferase [Treponema sp.]
MKRIILKPGEERRILLGHPWVFDNEIAAVLDSQGVGLKSAGVKPAVLVPGEIADVESSDKKYLGRAFVNPNSKITARIYSPSKEGVDKGFFKHRIRAAILRRMPAGQGNQNKYDLTSESARLVFAEADFLPALIIDRYAGWPLEKVEAVIKNRPFAFNETEQALGPPASWIAVQFLCWAADERREMILDALEETLAAPLDPGMEALGKPAGIIEKSGSKVRELEGLPLREGIARGTLPRGGIVIFENNLPFILNLEEGQKTGHFLDQKENRRLASVYLGDAGGRDYTVLDACCYTGGFALHAARAGARAVTCVDVSASALETLEKNAELNGVSQVIKTVKADVFEYLPLADRRKEHFDMIILDPPAFAKSKSSLDDAVRGYKEINLRAISLLNPGGILVTCSCSQAMDETRFKRMITEAAADAGRRLAQLDFRFQAPDHPVLVGYDESLYLKCGFYRALD